MEKEPPLNTARESDILETKLRRSWHFIEKVRSQEIGPTQCDTCIDGGNFEFYDEIYMIDDEPFCGKHKDGVMKKLEQRDADSIKRKEGEETLTEDEQSIRKLLIEAYGKEREFWREEERIRKIKPNISLGEIIKKLYQEMEEEQWKKE